MKFYESPEYRQRYWEEKKNQYERGQSFINSINVGDIIKLERYAILNSSPYSLSPYSKIHTSQTVKVYAINKNHGNAWFTTYSGEAIEADSIIKWRKLSQQQTLEF